MFFRVLAIFLMLPTIVWGKEVTHCNAFYSENGMPCSEKLNNFTVVEKVNYTKMPVYEKTAKLCNKENGCGPIFKRGEKCEKCEQEPIKKNEKTYVKNYTPSANLDYDYVHRECKDFMPINFKYVDFRLKKQNKFANYINKLGDYRFRIFGCRRNDKEMFLNVGRTMQKDMNFFDIFNEEYGQCIPQIKMPTDLCDANSSSPMPEYILTAEIVDYAMNVCDEFDWKTVKSTENRKGSSEMTVVWRLMDVARQNVFWKGTSTGYATLEDGTIDGEVVLVEESFREALKQLRYLDGFEKQIATAHGDEQQKSYRKLLADLESFINPAKCAYVQKVEVARSGDASLPNNGLNYDFYVKKADGELAPVSVNDVKEMDFDTQVFVKTEKGEVLPVDMEVVEKTLNSSVVEENTVFLPVDVVALENGGLTESGSAVFVKAADGKFVPVDVKILEDGGLSSLGTQAFVKTSKGEFLPIDVDSVKKEGLFASAFNKFVKLFNGMYVAVKNKIVEDGEVSTSLPVFVKDKDGKFEAVDAEIIEKDGLSSLGSEVFVQTSKGEFLPIDVEVFENAGVSSSGSAVFVKVEEGVFVPVDIKVLEEGGASSLGGQVFVKTAEGKFSPIDVEVVEEEGGFSSAFNKFARLFNGMFVPVKDDVEDGELSSDLGVFVKNDVDIIEDGGFSSSGSSVFVKTENGKYIPVSVNSLEESGFSSSGSEIFVEVLETNVPKDSIVVVEDGSLVSDGSSLDVSVVEDDILETGVVDGETVKEKSTIVADAPLSQDDPFFDDNVFESSESFDLSSVEERAPLDMEFVEEGDIFAVVEGCEGSDCDEIVKDVFERNKDCDSGTCKAKDGSCKSGDCGPIFKRNEGCDSAMCRAKAKGESCKSGDCGPIFKRNEGCDKCKVAESDWIDIPVEEDKQEIVEAAYIESKGVFCVENELANKDMDPYNVYKTRASMVEISSLSGLKQGVGLIINDQFILTSADLISEGDNNFRAKAINGVEFGASGFRFSPSKNVALLLADEKIKYTPLPLELNLPPVGATGFMTMGMNIQEEGGTEGYVDNETTIKGYRFSEDKGAEIITDKHTQSLTVGGALVDSKGNIYGIAHYGKKLNEEEPDLYMPIETALKSLSVELCGREFLNKEPWRKSKVETKVFKAPKAMKVKEVK
ncbi:MAG: hypothetical protein R3Y43_06660 [Alphaproteobacteria bacterium]